MVHTNFFGSRDHHVEIPGMKFMRQNWGFKWGNRNFFLRHQGTKTLFSGISYEKIVQEKDPGNRENGGYGASGRG